MGERYEAFTITKVDGRFLQGKTHNDKRREFALVIHRDLATNALILDVVPHFTDPKSVPHFEDSNPWLPEERVG